MSVVADAVVDTARQGLGPVGVCLPVSLTSPTPFESQRAAVGRLGRAGYRAVWTNEVIGKDALVQLAMLLAATDRTVFGTCIANIWARPAQTMHAAAAQLAEAHPGRFVLGLGVGYPQQAASVTRDFGSPLATMRDYLETMGEPTWPPAPDAAFPRVIAANGPKMLDLAAKFADGAMPAMLPVESTKEARRALGPDKLLVVALSVIAEAGAAREAVANRLGVPSYAQRLRALGYSDRDIAEVSDGLVNAIVAQGDPGVVAARVNEHIAAGADHVILLPPIGAEFATAVEDLERVVMAHR
nr:TIGR03620 family F420-dependent LLM class oxidoreductase [Mycobacterium saskatchewanense]